MKPESIELLAEPADIHDFVMSLWSDGPIRRSHASGGSVKRLVDRFARLPRFFFRASDQRIEWTHFSTWWGGILLCDYDSPAIRDLRYLHEIHHAATLSYIPNGNLPTFEAKAFRNEREASTATEMAVYLEFPELRPLTFDHPIFVDRFLFPEGDFSRPNPRLLSRWRSERDIVFQELMYERTRFILADEKDVDPDDPQIVWLRRYGEQGANWVKVWSRRFQSVEDSMIRLREDGATSGRGDAGRRHLDWLLSPEIAEGTDVPFRTEAAEFRAGFDALIHVYDEAMVQARQTPVKGKGDS
ncbi:MAG: hypothetical protein QOJ91_978 [Sphingomonadales bacterium]|jgi:hypothetical protein|nr:hypothetical protein [Sphingomonadales bacterium]